MVLRYHSRLPSGKNFSRASLLTMCTAKSPASIMAQPPFTRRLVFGGSGSGGRCVRSCQEESKDGPVYGRESTYDSPDHSDNRLDRPTFFSAFFYLYASQL